MKGTSMTIYLYKKTHNQTGLQYLGKTIQDPYKYKGSGTRWINHLNAHGYDVTTEILKECHTNDEVKNWGSYYSDLWDVVVSKDWANLKPESGEGGSTSEMVRKALETKKINGTLRPKKESIDKMKRTRETRGLNKQTTESIAKGIETKKKNGTLNNITPESIAKGLETRKLRNKMNVSTPESIAKQRSTRIQNGTVNTNTLASVDKALTTKLRNGTLDPGKYKASCIWCHATMGTPQLFRWHGDNCSKRNFSGLIP